MGRMAVATICNLVLRFFALATTVVAAIVMATAEQDTRYFILQLQADYRNTPSFVYFFGAYLVGAGYSLLSMFIPPRSLIHRLVLVLDVVIVILLTSSMSAATAVAYIGKKGNSYAGWQRICNRVDDFCDQVIIALAIGLLAVLIYVILVFYSIYLTVSSARAPKP